MVDLFAALDLLEERLAARRCLVGGRPTEFDLRLIPPLIRFDVADDGALRCNLRRQAGHPNPWADTRRLHHLRGVALTVRLDHVKRHHGEDHAMINRRIVPIGPALDLGDPSSIAAA